MVVGWTSHATRWSLWLSLLLQFSLFDRLVVPAAVHVARRLILEKPKLVAVVALFMLRNHSVALVFELGDEFSVVDSELNGGLDQAGVLFHHFVKFFLVLHR